MMNQVIIILSIKAESLKSVYLPITMHQKEQKVALPSNWEGLTTEQIREDVMRRQKKREGNSSWARGRYQDPVKVQLLSLEELPGPLSKREFGEACRLEGLTMNTGQESPSMKQYEQDKNFAKEMQRLRERENARWNNTISHFFGAYLAIYDLFKQWHCEVIEDRNIVGPDKDKRAVVGQPTLQQCRINELKEERHLQRHRKLVNVLIEFGLGSGANTQRSIGSMMPAEFPQPIFSPVADHNNLQLPMFQVHPLPSNHHLSDTPSANSKISLCSSSDSVIHHSSQSNSKAPGTSRSPSKVTVHGHLPAHRLNGDLAMFSDINHHRQVMRQKSQEGLDNTHPQQTMKNKILITQSVYETQQSCRSNKKPSQHCASPLSKKRIIFDVDNFTSPYNNQRLVSQLKETRQKLQKAEQELVVARTSNKKVLSKYIQEEAYRNMDFKAFAQLPSDKAEAIKSEVESRFFNISDGLEPNMVKIMNAKISQIRDFFVNQINMITFQSDVTRQKVVRMEAANEGGIKFEQLDSERLIEQLSLIEEDKREQNQRLCKIDQAAKARPEMSHAKFTWDLLTKYFGRDYFLDAVETEYGIAPGQNDKLAYQIQRHFQQDIGSLKRQQIEREKHLEKQINQLQEEIQELLKEKTKLMRRAERDQERLKQENQRRSKILVENAKEAIERRFKNSLQQAYKRVEEMDKLLKNQSRSHKNMQMNYGWKRWVMFTKMNSLIKKTEEGQRTEIDVKMLQIAERFLQEEFLIILYSRKEKRNSEGALVPVQDALPEPVVLDQIQGDRVRQLKSILTECQQKVKTSQFVIEQHEQSIQQYECELSNLYIKNTELKLQIPALEAQKKMYEEAMEAKEEECRLLEGEVRNIESRWKSGARAPHKVTAKGILAALQLKSLNELTGSKIRSAMQLTSSRRSKDQETITQICGLDPKYTIPGLTRVPLHHKQTQMETVQVQEVAVGDLDHRMWDAECQKDPDLVSSETQTNTGLINRKTSNEKRLRQTLVHQKRDSVDEVEPVQVDIVQDFVPSVPGSVRMGGGQATKKHGLRHSMKKSYTTVFNPPLQPPAVVQSKEYHFPATSRNKSLTAKEPRLEAKTSINSKLAPSGQPRLKRQRTFHAKNSTTQGTNAMVDSQLEKLDEKQEQELRTTFMGAGVRSGTSGGIQYVGRKGQGGGESSSSPRIYSTSNDARLVRNSQETSEATLPLKVQRIDDASQTLQYVALVGTVSGQSSLLDKIQRESSMRSMQKYLPSRGQSLLDAYPSPAGKTHQIAQNTLEKQSKQIAVEINLKNMKRGKGKQGLKSAGVNMQQQSEVKISQQKQSSLQHGIVKKSSLIITKPDTTEQGHINHMHKTSIQQDDGKQRGAAAQGKEYSQKVLSQSIKQMGSLVRGIHMKPVEAKGGEARPSQSVVHQPKENVEAQGATGGQLGIFCDQFERIASPMGQVELEQQTMDQQKTLSDGSNRHFPLILLDHLGEENRSNKRMRNDFISLRSNRVHSADQSSEIAFDHNNKHVMLHQQKIVQSAISGVETPITTIASQQNQQQLVARQLLSPLRQFEQHQHHDEGEDDDSVMKHLYGNKSRSDSDSNGAANNSIRVMDQEERPVKIAIAKAGTTNKIEESFDRYLPLVKEHDGEFASHVSSDGRKKNKDNRKMQELEQQEVKEESLVHYLQSANLVKYNKAQVRSKDQWQVSSEQLQRSIKGCSNSKKPAAESQRSQSLAQSAKQRGGSGEVKGDSFENSAEGSTDSVQSFKSQQDTAQKRRPLVTLTRKSKAQKREDRGNQAHNQHKNRIRESRYQLKIIKRAPKTMSDSEGQEEEEDVQNASLSGLNHLQKLLYNGHINEQQFVCLQMLEKGFGVGQEQQEAQDNSSKSPDMHQPEQQSRSNSKHHKSEANEVNLPSSSSEIKLRQQRLVKPRISPDKLQGLKKIFEHVDKHLGESSEQKKKRKKLRTDLKQLRKQRALQNDKEETAELRQHERKKSNQNLATRQLVEQGQNSAAAAASRYQLPGSKIIKIIQTTHLPETNFRRSIISSDLHIEGIGQEMLPQIKQKLRVTYDLNSHRHSTEQIRCEKNPQTQPGSSFSQRNLISPMPHTQSQYFTGGRQSLLEAQQQELVQSGTLRQINRKSLRVLRLNKNMPQSSRTMQMSKMTNPSSFNNKLHPLVLAELPMTPGANQDLRNQMPHFLLGGTQTGRTSSLSGHTVLPGTSNTKID